MGDEGHNSRIADVPATQADPIYGIGDVVALTGISASPSAITTSAGSSRTFIATSAACGRSPRPTLPNCT